MYVELHCASAFSFLQGASLPETLIERAATLGYTSLALLDADGVYGAPRFHKAAKQAGLKPIVGAELTIGTGIRDPGSGIRTIRIPDPRSRVSSWDRDEWDVALGDGVAYRVFRERGSGAWFVEGAFD